MLSEIHTHLKDRRGDIYIQMMICLTLFLIVAVIVFTVASSFSTKLWLDERLDDITKIIDSTGETKNDSITALENEIKNRLGGTITYEATYLNNDAEKGWVQLNEKVKVRYHNDKYSVISIFGNEIATEIDITKTAVSSWYHKPEDHLIDDYSEAEP